MDSINYKEEELEKIQNLFDGSLILIVSATDIETNSIHNKLTPLYGFDSIIKHFDGNLTYYFGVFGCYKIAHVQCAMGSISRDSSIMTVSTALQKLHSKVVIMIGIAFGVDEVKQKIGDVLIAESVIPYDTKRVGKKDTIHRGMEAQSSQLLVNRFKNIRTWEHIINGGTKAKTIFTRLLSGEELVDNIQRRDELTKTFPDSKGGEMEGAGVYSACGNKIDWILVKGICDFANGDKGENKKINQQIAIESALSLCLELFTSTHAFEDVNISPIETQSENSLIENPNINEVLFDYYDASKAKYYIERQFDKLFNDKFKQYGIWLYGPSGCGKSNLIVRNLIYAKKEYLQINLSPCIGDSIDSFFNEILFEISSKVEGVYSVIQPKSFNECNRALIDLLNRFYSNKELIIFIEEIPIDSEKSQKEFAEKLFALIISKSFFGSLSKIKLVLSSINDPSISIPQSQHKIHQHLSFIGLENWETNEIELLITLIEKEFNFKLNTLIKSELIHKANGSPRFVKKFFRSIYTVSKTDDITLKQLLKETERELNQI